MKATDAAAEQTSQNPSLRGAASEPRSASSPLFYRQPVPLSSVTHASWRLKGGDVAYASDTNALPVMVGEFGAAAHSYPLVFAAKDASPVALVGLQQLNVFVSDGKWSEGHYIPAYVRRYPFVFIHVEDQDRFVLAVDAGSERIVRQGEEGVPLFDNGAPTDVTKQALEFCRAFTGEHRATSAFSAALRAQGLLTARHADVVMPNGRKLSLSGFEVVDAEKFAALPDAVVVEWHRKGWLRLVNLHLASLDRFTDLLSRQSARDSNVGAVAH
ncbi:SapC family protein [Steroidobacter sp. S1-65]|uniref:SapC family protein n=1 Tax=Steroidobacter gossypii TaxID=2805490 RepID=A0ABS1WZG7_9GAMM|nr:SapC family protein [Steroidobacter gossypii]MBM0106364.1 SapC family protein [Steroidobacter gossypii]